MDNYSLCKRADEDEEVATQANDPRKILIMNPYIRMFRQELEDKLKYLRSQQYGMTEVQAAYVAGQEAEVEANLERFNELFRIQN